MLLGLSPYDDNNHATAHTATYARKESGPDPVLLSTAGLPGTRKTKVSTGTLGSPFNEVNSATGNTVVPAGHSTKDKDRERKRAIRDAMAQQQAQQQTQAQNQAHPQSRFAFPGSEANPSSSAAVPVPPSAAIPAASSARKPPPVSGYNGANLVPGTGSDASGNGTGARARKDSAASEQSLKKDDLLERLAGALKWVFSFILSSLLFCRAYY